MRVFGVGQRVTDHDLGHSRDGDDVSGDRLLGGAAVYALGGEQLGDLRVGDDRMAVHLTHPRHLLALADPAVVDADQRQASEEGRRVEVGDQRLQRGLRVALGRRNVLEQDVEQGVEVVPLGHLAIGGLDGAGDTGTAGGVQGGQPERVLGGLLCFFVQVGGDVEQQVVAVGDHLGDTGVGTVGLVDDQNHRQVRGESLAQHEPGLRQRALGGVDQQQHAVDHRQAALHLAAEIGVAGVSMTLMTVIEPSAWWRCTAVFLARMVMPFSFSRSPESIRRSTASSPRCESAPDCLSIASTRVVLPWSTCATMATFRKLWVTSANSGSTAHSSRNRRTIGVTPDIATPIVSPRSRTPVKASKVARLKPKKKCCKSKPRCTKCPVVVHKMQKAEHHGLSEKELKKVLHRARAH
ncbi:hypothetical protein L829_1978 [Mycobacteroides abscessus MAB_030201_1075]|uniref:Uncharacterized protein n=2 Tax=Mycobacteroides abscessus TaxID=36809 RepID=A0A829PHT2_9MYCO|nr:hypothetical protein L829_1978 [Mycobacteroides abscessus MAB_030201_1075]